MGTVPRVSQAAQQLDAVKRAGLTCDKCGSSRLHRSKTRGAREQLLKLFTETRAWRCGECNARQLSDLRPQRRRRSRPETEDFRPNPGPDPKPAPSPEPHPNPAPAPDPKPRRKDPLAERLKLRRRKRMMITAALVVLAGLGGAVLVMRTSGPDNSAYAE